jgi:hypothetical protein
MVPTLARHEFFLQVQNLILKTSLRIRQFHMIAAITTTTLLPLEATLLVIRLVPTQQMILFRILKILLFRNIEPSWDKLPEISDHPGSQDEKRSATQSLNCQLT